MINRLRVFEEKIEEYYLSCMPSIAQIEDKAFLSEWPFYKFSIVRLFDAMAKSVTQDALKSLSDKLIDIKLHYSYLLTLDEHFYRGATLIVGNNKLMDLNPRTISLLRGIHYRVYLISVLVEQTLDLLCLVLTGNASNLKKGKWEKIIATVQLHTNEKIICPSDAILINAFKNEFRTAEMHKFSMVRSFTAKEQWNHLQLEEQAISRILANLYSHYVQPKN
jgi:hypothetical protein